MNNWPEVIRKADLHGLLEAVKEIGAGTAGETVIETGGLEALFSFFERMVPLLEKSSQSIMNMRAFEARNQPQDVADGVDADGWYAAGSDVYIDDDGPGDRAPRREPRQQQAPEAPATETRDIDPQKVFAAILATMAGLPSDMTMGKALQLARDNKAAILSNISAELAKL